ncbi:MAG: hypothetical protein M4579_005586 [Chaenotheca gracillima]|nr:MAG: hypothetical protein M4579_005586 [Chaenotheca gracillima]
MSPLFGVYGAAAVILSITSLTSASPTLHSLRNAGKNLAPRLETNYVDCNDDQKSKLGTSFADAAALANIAFNIDQASSAFKHYLRDEDRDQAKSLWSAVASNNDPTNPSYTFSVRCARAGDKGCGTKSLANTDPRPQDGDTVREMKICPVFFTADETKNSLDSRKYDGDKRGSWCQLGQHFKDFETAGHTLLHEMTHLDALGASAGVPGRQDPDGFLSHGTDDVDGFGDSYVDSARGLLNAWVNDPDSIEPDSLKPWQNAENIAAAATEWWFIKSCGFTEIDL